MLYIRNNNPVIYDNIPLAQAILLPDESLLLFKFEELHTVTFTNQYLLSKNEGKISNLVTDGHAKLFLSVKMLILIH